MKPGLGNSPDGTGDQMGGDPKDDMEDGSANLPTRRSSNPGQGGDTGAHRRRPISERRPTTPRVTVIVPVKNEAGNVPLTLPPLKNHYEVILVDGHSTDGTVEAARRALPDIRVIEQTRNGKGNAMACGFAAATGDAIVMFDADGSADPGEIPRFIAALTDGADLAKGSRFLPGGGSADITLFRRLGNSGLNWLAGFLTGRRLTDLCYGYNAFWADQVYLLDLPDPDADVPAMTGDGFEIEALIIGRFAMSGAKITEVPSFEYLRWKGSTHLNAIRDGVRVLRTLLQDRIHAKQTRALAQRRHLERLPGPPLPGWVRE